MFLVFKWSVFRSPLYSVDEVGAVVNLGLWYSVFSRNIFVKIQFGALDLALGSSGVSNYGVVRQKGTFHK